MATQAQLNQAAANLALTVQTNITNGSGSGNPTEMIRDLAAAVLALVAYNQNDTLALIGTSKATANNVSLSGIVISPHPR